jgi:hypothetical protein
MGKATGFLEFPRQNEGYEAPEARVKHYKEFVFALADNEADQQLPRVHGPHLPGAVRSGLHAGHQ